MPAYVTAAVSFFDPQLTFPDQQVWPKIDGKQRMSTPVTCTIAQLKKRRAQTQLTPVGPQLHPPVQGVSPGRTATGAADGRS